MGEYGYDQLQCDALGFVLEDETWPVFLQWARDNAVSDQAREWLESAPESPHQYRIEWMRNSPDPHIRAAADVVAVMKDLPS